MIVSFGALGEDMAAFNADSAARNAAFRQFAEDLASSVGGSVTINEGSSSGPFLQPSTGTLVVNGISVPLSRGDMSLSNPAGWVQTYVDTQMRQEASGVSTVDQAALYGSPEAFAQEPIQHAVYNPYLVNPAAANQDYTQHVAAGIPVSYTPPTPQAVVLPIVTPAAAVVTPAPAQTVVLPPVVTPTAQTTTGPSAISTALQQARETLSSLTGDASSWLTGNTLLWVGGGAAVLLFFMMKGGKGR